MGQKCSSLSEVDLGVPLDFNVLPIEREIPHCDEINLEKGKGIYTMSNVNSVNKYVVYTVRECYKPYLLTDEQMHLLLNSFSVPKVYSLTHKFRIVRPFNCRSRCDFYRAITMTNEIVVLKTYHRKMDGDLHDIVFSEIFVQSHIFHPNIVRLIDYYNCKHYTHLVMEEMEGSVYDLILRRHVYVPEPIIRYILRSVVSATAYLHMHGIIHRDIRSDNILIRDGIIKLCDFKLATFLTRSLPYCTRSIGNPYWMSPEIIKGTPYDFCTDIWNIGTFLLEFVNGGPPHYGINPFKALFLNGGAEVPPTVDAPEKWSGDLLDFCTKCLQLDPVKRATASELLAHPFLMKGVASRKEFANFVASIPDEK